MTALLDGSPTHDNGGEVPANRAYLASHNPSYVGTHISAERRVVLRRLPRSVRVDNADKGRVIPTTDGRTVLIRSCFQGEGVQVGIIGKRGSMVESVSFDACQLPILLGALEDAGANALRTLTARADADHASLLDRLAEVERKANSPFCTKGHKRTKANTFKTADGRKHCRICRRESVAAYRKERGLT